MLNTLLVITNHLRSDLNQLRSEVDAMNGIMVRPTWQAQTHHYPATLWAFVMAGFARLDLYSRLWNGDATKGQTPRMRDFLKCYLPRDPLADALAIQLWRHTLMHTSRPRRLRDQSGREYSYLLHWGSPELSRAHHYQVSGGNKLDFGLAYFLDDLDTLLTAYLEDLARSSQLQMRALAIWPKIETQDFTV